MVISCVVVGVIGGFVVGRSGGCDDVVVCGSGESVSATVELLLLFPFVSIF